MKSQTKNTKTRNQMDAMVRKAFAGIGLHESSDAVQELTGGWFNAAYVLRLADEREVVLKIAPPSHAEVMRYERNLMDTEVTTMQMAGETAGIPVPSILYHDKSGEVCDSAYFFMEKVEGDSLEHVHAQLSTDEQAALDREIGTIIRKINGIAGTYFGYPGNPDLRAPTWRAAFLKIMDSVYADAASKSVVLEHGEQELRAVVEKHIESLDEVTRPCLVHWDAWKPNFLVKHGRISGIIDFERALWAEPLMEAQFRSLCWEGVNACMHGYGKTTFTANEMRRNWLYLLHLALVMHIECYFRNYGTDEILNASRKLLASAMEWLRNH